MFYLMTHNKADSSALSSSIRSFLANEWESAYNGKANPLEIHAKGNLARKEAASKGRTGARNLSAGRPGSTVYTLAGVSLPAYTVKTGCHKGEYVAPNGRPYKDKAAYLADRKRHRELAK